MTRFKFSFVLLLSVLALSVSGPASAVKKPTTKGTHIAQGPIFDPKSRSYFEVKINNMEGYWQFANKRAMRSSYKGRKGRLALIKDPETLDFVRKNFRVNREIWIGMRYFCTFRKLIWVTGDIQPLKSPGMWAPQWYRNKQITCNSTGNIKYMPVYITVESRGLPAWQATGSGKGFRAYLVEYPAPPVGKAEATKSKGSAKK